jgi:hypothetical protein
MINNNNNNNNNNNKEQEASKKGLTTRDISHTHLIEG